jgi:hypothetical protein
MLAVDRSAANAVHAALSGAVGRLSATKSRGDAGTIATAQRTLAAGTAAAAEAAAIRAAFDQGGELSAAVGAAVAVPWWTDMAEARECALTHPCLEPAGREATAMDAARFWQESTIEPAFAATADVIAAFRPLSRTASVRALGAIRQRQFARPSDCEAGILAI